MIYRICSIFTLLFLLTWGKLAATDWLVWQKDGIQVWSAPKDKVYADLVLTKLIKRIDAFQMKLGVYPETLLVLKIVPNRREYQNLTRGKGKLVEFSEAFYSPKENVIYVRSPDQISHFVYEDILMHEYIHWFLDETLENVPLWFHEGMAMFYSGQFGFQSYFNFTRYRFMGYRLSLNQMYYAYPENKTLWNLFYLTSVFAINFLQSTHNESWQRFWNIVGYEYNRSDLSPDSKTDFVAAFNKAYASGLYEISRDFDKTLNRYGWQFPLVGINALILSFLPFIIIFGWIRNRKKLKSLPDVDLDEDINTGDEPETEAANTKVLDRNTERL